MSPSWWTSPAAARTTWSARGLAALCRLDHRGARGAEPNTGDGAGITIGIPDEFLRAVVDFPLPPVGSYATGIVFLPTDADEARKAVQVLEKYAVVEGAQDPRLARRADRRRRAWARPRWPPCHVSGRSS